MKNLLIVLIIMIMPLFANAQGFNRNLPFSNSDDRPPKLVELPTMKPISQNRVEKIQSKLTREEEKLIKLARKTWNQEDDLKKEQEELKNLENDSQKINNPDYQKKIEALKKTNS